MTCGAVRGRGTAAVQDLDDALVLDGDAAAGPHARRDRIDEIRIRHDQARHG